MSNTKSKHNILAFAHIGKTGGTTLIHILRKNYFLQYCDVVPLSNPSGKLLTADDLKKTMRINPFIRCIAGHSVRPYGDLKKGFPGLQYTTLLREPVARCISQYQQRVKKYGEIEFREFLQRNWLPNLQTRFIAGGEDLDKAKSILKSDFLVAGVLEKFDEFLAVLVDKLAMPDFDPTYTIRRVEKDKTFKNRLLEEYGEEVESIHNLDMELYRYVRDDLFPDVKRSCGPDYQVILDNIVESRAYSKALDTPKAVVDYLLRKAYYRPLLGAMQWVGGKKGQ